MRRILVGLAAATALAAPVAVATATPASAATASNCIDPVEKANLRLGMTTKQVNASTKAHPWFKVSDEIDGQPYAIYAYNDCRKNSGKVVGVAYRIDSGGIQHYALARYIVL